MILKIKPESEPIRIWAHFLGSKSKFLQLKCVGLSRYRIPLTALYKSY